jgi:hypothetical protein
MKPESFGLALSAALLATCVPAPARTAPASTQITVPAADLLVGNRITAASWPGHVIRTPDEDGQFEVLVRKTAVPGIDAPACRSPWLLVRMPAVLPPVDADYHPKPRNPANQHRLDAARTEYAALAADASAGRPATVHVNGADYATGTGHGLKLSGCNLFFTAPAGG